MADNTQIYPKGYVYGINPNEENQVRLNDLADVAANAPEDGQVLTFNVRRNGWEAKTPTGGTPGPGGTTDYEDLDNKPSINGNELIGNKTAADLDLDYGVIDPNLVTHKFGKNTEFNYAWLHNKPKINGIDLYGDQSDLDLHITDYKHKTITDTQTITPVVNFKNEGTAATHIIPEETQEGLILSGTLTLDTESLVLFDVKSGEYTRLFTTPSNIEVIVHPIIAADNQTINVYSLVDFDNVSFIGAYSIKNIVKLPDTFIKQVVDQKDNVATGTTVNFDIGTISDEVITLSDGSQYDVSFNVMAATADGDPVPFDSNWNRMPLSGFEVSSFFMSAYDKDYGFPQITNNSGSTAAHIKCPFTVFAKFSMANPHQP